MVMPEYRPKSKTLSGRLSSCVNTSLMNVISSLTSKVARTLTVWVTISLCTPTTAHLLHEGDLLVICSLDRLGRNYTEIREQWEHITRTLKADIKVLDMPLLDTTESTGSSLDKRFVSDLVLQILSYVAEKERESLLKRQRQGIDVMPIVNGKRMSLKKGKGATGRPNAVYPDNWEPVFNEWKSGKITAVKAMEQLGLKRTTFYKLAKNYKKGEEE